MNRSVRPSLAFAVAVLLAATGTQATASAVPAIAASARAAPGQADAMSPQERGESARQLVLRWGYYVQRVYGVPLETWAERMVPNLVHADPANLRAALQRDTYEGAMAELAGTGTQLPDEAVITALAKAAEGDGTQALGALANDLVYTPLAPCRILDTRVAGGAIPGDGTRSFLAINAANFTAQGGSATACGTLGLNATAVAVNLTAVTPVNAGFATAYRFGASRPLASSLNYTAGAIVNNALIIQIPNPLSTFDFTLYSFAQSHYVADIVGYFAPPVATALDCLDTSQNAVTVAPNDTVNASAPLCPTGYTETATYCRAGLFDVPLVVQASGGCSARNNTAATTTLSASRRCCRVPGR